MKKHAYLYMLISVSFASILFAEDYWPLKPIWEGDSVKGESVLFVKEGSSYAQANLVFNADNILKIYSPSTGKVFKKGVDYKLSRKGNVIELPEGSSIPSISVDQLYKEPGSANSIKSCKNRDKDLLFKEGTLFHDLQVEVDYLHANDHWKGIEPVYQGLKLSGLQNKMKNRKKVKLVMYGDSISTGANASSKVNAEPFMPFYGELVALALESKCDCRIELCNLSKGGQTSFYGVRNIDKVIEEKPDLVMIAWGMNDASGKLSAQKYQDNISQQIELIRSSVPECEFVLVSTMYGNPEWTRSSPELYPQYRDSLNELCKDGVVIADVTSVFGEMLKYKRFADLTNNGVNHPNDFGHRIYAQTILAVLLEDTSDLNSLVLCEDKDG